MISDSGYITYAYLETTNYCNLDCSFCNRMDVIGPLKHMSLDKWEKLLNGISHHPITEAKLMGMVDEIHSLGTPEHLEEYLEKT